jgi:hypothetical protein
MARSQNRKPLTTVGFGLKKMACFVKLSSVQRAIGNVIVVNTKIFGTKASSAINAVSKLRDPQFAGNG